MKATHWFYSQSFAGRAVEPERRHNCAYCGTDIGAWDRFCDRNDTCGKQECERWARDNAIQERDEAHEQLDRDMGWS